MDENLDADKDEYEDKLKEVTDKVEPIISKLYQADGMGGDDDYEDMGDHDEL